MTLYKNNEKLSGYSATIGKLFGGLGLSANVYTALALLFAFITAYFLLTGNFVCAAAAFAISAFLDSVDGAVARFRKDASKRGAYLDTISDRYMEGVVIIAIMFLALPIFYLSSYMWAALYLFGSLMITYAKAEEIEKLNKEVRGGLLERPERMILLFLVIALLAVLANITALQRISIALRK